ncbi:hypothetical protein HK14_10365 [Acetobacter cibinongensis]|uniref:Uncharacterized protein n=1 Tax=Acetobacter cibinongensis TaxID=146475 RepID=A0A1Z5YYA5_9PROT|nr:hypothetical protein HK14_10365 [Acetobacter cibinongensis]
MKKDEKRSGFVLFYSDTTPGVLLKTHGRGCSSRGGGRILFQNEQKNLLASQSAHFLISGEGITFSMLQDQDR